MNTGTTLDAIPAMLEQAAMATGESSGKEYTIDELAMESRIPSRTIRFYQSTGALPKPVIRGRVAYYGATHLERLAQITQLQDRGLQIKAIRDVLSQAEKGDFSLQDWLGSHDQLATSWSGDMPKVLTEADLQTELGDRRPGLVGDLVRLGALERRGEGYLVESPQLFSLALRLDKVGVPMDTVSGAFKLLSKHLGRLAEDLTSYFVKNGDALGNDVDDTFSELRPVSLEAVRVVFGREMERAVRRAGESGAVATLTKRKKHVKKR